ncbi:hypothetical protein DITRI_Ditri09bG0086100 [Diplodiscus trichospermus]
MANPDHGQNLDPSTFPTPQALLHWRKPRLPPDTVTLWGSKPGTKNVHNLWLELTLGESTLSNTNPPLCTVEIVLVMIINNFNNKKVLHESYQLLSNGTMQPCWTPLSKRMKTGESPEDAAHRAIKEEFGSLLQVDDVKKVVQIVPGTYKKEENKMMSWSYPGLKSTYVMHTVNAYVEGLPQGKFSTETEEFGDCGDQLKDVVEKALRVKRRSWIWRSVEEGSSAAI